MAHLQWACLNHVFPYGKSKETFSESSDYNNVKLPILGLMAQCGNPAPSKRLSHWLASLSHEIVERRCISGIVFTTTPSVPAQSSSWSRRPYTRPWTHKSQCPRRVRLCLRRLPKRRDSDAGSEHRKGFQDIGSSSKVLREEFSECMGGCDTFSALWVQYIPPSYCD